MGFFESKFFKYLKNFIIGIAAAVIMIGAYMKITHQDGADAWLMYGLFTEAFIFALQGILPPKKDYYWEKLYPNLDTYNRKKKVAAADVVSIGASGGGSSATAELDKMLENSNINQNMIDKLGDSLRGLGTSVDGLSNVTSTLEATDEYTVKAREAAKALSDVQAAYSQAAEVANSLTISTDDTKGYHEQVQTVTKNLAALNAVYELELQDTNNHLKAMNKFYGNLSTAITNLDDSLEDTKKYKDQMSSLTKNLTNLNSVYGNMLAAMQGGGR